MNRQQTGAGLVYGVFIILLLTIGGIAALAILVERNHSQAKTANIAKIRPTDWVSLPVEVVFQGRLALVHTASGAQGCTVKMEKVRYNKESLELQVTFDFSSGYQWYGINVCVELLDKNKTSLAKSKVQLANQKPKEGLSFNRDGFSSDGSYSASFFFANRDYQDATRAKLTVGF